MLTFRVPRLRNLCPPPNFWPGAEFKRAWGVETYFLEREYSLNTSVVLSLTTSEESKEAMSKDDVDQQLNTSWELPEIVDKLRHVVAEVEETVPNQRTKDMMYELVELVLQCGERLHELETRMVGYGNPVEENARRDERIRMDLQKDRRDGVERDETYNPGIVPRKK